MSLWGVIGTVAGAYFGGPLGAMVGGSIGGAIDQNNAIGDARDQQQQSTDAAIGEQRRQFDLTRGDYAPYREAGVNALGQLQTEMGRMPTAEEVMSDPGYQFGLQQGQLGLDRKAAAQGGRVSGAALKAASGYATNYAASGYGAAYQRRQDRLNRLAAIAGIGQSSTAGSAQAGQASTGAISNLISGQGNANAAATIGQGNVWGNTVNQLGAIGQRWAQQQTTPRNPGWGGTADDPWYG
jgi:hypothetical protein